MDRPRTPRACLVVGALALAWAGWWASGLVVDPPWPDEPGPALAAAETPDAIVSEYERTVAPILAAKCFQCHTDTAERPFFHVLPVLGGYVERTIERGRDYFDFGEGLPVERLGAALEFAQGLREVAAENAMPPLAYALARPTSYLNTGERDAIVRWADHATAGIWAGLDADGLPEGRAPLGHAELEALARSLAEACPLADPTDVGARDACVRALDALAPFERFTRDPLLWGQQRTAGQYALAGVRSTRFNPRVWRRLYAPSFMYGPGHRIVEDGPRTVLHVPVRFRDGLDAGHYPYPFWHDPGKWGDYATTTELLFVVRGGAIVGVLRGAEQRDRAVGTRTWDGRWRWTDAAGDAQPAPAVLFTHVLSPGNPHRAPLEASFRALSGALRDARCHDCHSPDNGAGMQMLELINYPNQALAARNRIVTTLELDAMPPAGGLADEAQRARLLDLARRFQRVANLALQHDDPAVEDRFDRPLAGPGS